MIAEPLQPLARPIGDLRVLDGNPRRGDVEAVKRSLKRFGQRKPIVARADGTVTAGNHTLLAARELGWAEIAVVGFDDDDATAKAYALADNRTSALGSFDMGDLAAMAAEVHAVDPGLLEAASFTEADLNAMLNGDGSANGDEPPRPSLADRFLIPPFDVLDTEQGAWRARKKQWVSLGFRSEEGRDGGLVLGGMAKRDPRYYEKKIAAEQRLGRALTTAEFEAEHYEPSKTSLIGGTSIFDPVLCELAYRWFCRQGGTVLDPFAGGSVRGLVAAILGRRYIGNDLSERQVRANLSQAEDFQQRGLIDTIPEWSVGDSAEWVRTLEPESADLIFTCPPYYDREVYSDDPADLSTMGYEAFDEAFDEAFADILAGAASVLRCDRFAVIVTGDARDKHGHLHDLRGPTVRAAQAAGLAYCSGAILATTFASLPMTCARTFIATRTLGRRHQDVLVFCKGSQSRAAKACGVLEISDLAELVGEPDDDDA